MEKENHKQRRGQDASVTEPTEATEAPGLEGSIDYDREASEKEVKKGEYTQVTRLTND